MSSGRILICEIHDDSIAHLLKEICHDVCVEPGLQPLTGKSLSYRSADVDDGARLDIAACGFCGIPHQRVHVFNPYAPSYQSVPVLTCYLAILQIGLPTTLCEFYWSTMSKHQLP